MKLPKLLFPASFIGTGIGLVAIVKDRVQGPIYDKDQKYRVSGRTVIVTGANSGIGEATAYDLAMRGARVVMACKDLNAGQKSRDKIIEDSCNPSVEVKELDLGSISSIVKFSKDICQDERRIDILVNNAGLMSSRRIVTVDGFEKNLGVNFLGAFLLTNLLLPKLAESSGSRVVNVTCETQEKGEINFDNLNGLKDYHSYVAYSQSKLGLMLMNQQLASRFKDNHVISCSVYPGFTKTGITRGLSTSKMSMGIWASILSILMRSPINGAQTVIFCCIDPSISEKDTGKLYKDLKEKEFTSKCDSYRLWCIAEKWTKLHEHKTLLEKYYHKASSTSEDGR